MTAPKAKASPASALPAARKEGTASSNGEPSARQVEFATVVGSIAKRYGVKVASASAPAKNPYAMSAEQAEKVALQAGIITKTGNLTRRFK
jgi:hypothetical protein